MCDTFVALSDTTASGNLIFGKNSDRERPSTIWLTGTSQPCLSVFKPFFIGGQTLGSPPWPLPGRQRDQSLWWQAEALHRGIGKNYREGQRFIRGSQQSLQRKLLQRERQLIDEAAQTDELDRLSWYAVENHRVCIRNAQVDLHRTSLKPGSHNPFYRFYRRRTDARAGLR